MVSPLDVKVFSIAPAIDAFAKGQNFARKRARDNTLIEVGQAAQGGNLDAARDAAFRGGLVGEGLQIDQMQASREATAEDRAFRRSEAERAQKNADRAFRQSERQFDAQMMVKLREIEAKHSKLSERLTPGQKKADEEFAKEHFVPFLLGGGAADAAKQQSQLRAAIRELKSSTGLTGPINAFLPDRVRQVVNPKGVDVQERVAEVAQRNLRLILGGQFAMKEGEQLLARAFNPALQEEVNARRVAALLKQMEIAAEQKMRAIRHFEEHGTLQGFKGKLPSVQDFFNAIEEADSGDGAQSNTMRTPGGRSFRVIN